MAIDFPQPPTDDHKMVSGGDEEVAGGNIQLQQARRAAGLTQAELAERTEISMSQISRFESGQREPRMGELMKIAEVLKVRIESIIPGATSQSPRPEQSPALQDTPPPPEQPLADREALQWLLTEAFQAFGLPEPQAHFLAAGLLEAASRPGFHRPAPQRQEVAREFLNSLIAAALIRPQKQ